MTGYIHGNIPLNLQNIRPGSVLQAQTFSKIVLSFAADVDGSMVLHRHPRCLVGDETEIDKITQSVDSVPAKGDASASDSHVSLVSDPHFARKQI